MSSDDRAAVEALLGRQLRGSFEVVVRTPAGEPVVIRNGPLLADGTPMPTRYWLVGREETAATGRLEAAGGVRQAELAVDPAELSAAHARYAAERDAHLPPGHAGPRPSGGVGGTRVGVKCLHAHLAWHLAGGSDPVGRWTAAQLGLDRHAYLVEGLSVAAIDCGTNSTRLLIAGANGATLDRQMIITRLGEGVDRTGVLAPAAVERTLAVLESYRSAMDAAGVGKWVATATSAARDAANAADFLGPAAAVLGSELQVLAGEREGMLSYGGATAELDPAGGPYLVVDVGGGSTELVTPRAGRGGGGRGGEVDAVSLDVGCVRVTERWLASDPPAPGELLAAESHVRELLEKSGVRERAAAATRMVGLAGTVSALTVLALGLVAYDRTAVHHAVLRLADIRRITAEMTALPVESRRRMPGMEVARADVLVGGAIVLATVMEWTGHDELVVSESDILDGLVADLLA
ncbi:MAG: DUF501 domain-containing protein [Acidimicrobiales bacterium]